MAEDDSFAVKVTQILAQSGWSNNSPWSLIEQWQSFIDQCKRGYRDNIYEYYNDIFIRKKIEIILSSSVILKEYEEFKDFLDKVKLFDEEFSALLQEDVKLPGYSHWWEQGVLQYAGEELAKDYYNDYKIKIRVV